MRSRVQSLHLLLRVVLVVFLLLLGIAAMGVHLGQFLNGYKTLLPRPQDQSQHVYQHMSNKSEALSQAEPATQTSHLPQTTGQPVQPQDGMIKLQIVSQATPAMQTPHAPNSVATSSSTGAPSPHECNGLCLMQGNPNGNYSHPEIVHYTYITGSSLQLAFRQYLSILSAHRFYRPQRILLHSNVAPSGTYWDLAVKTTGIEYNHVERVRRIGGKAPGWVEHEADYTKISQVLRYGGVSLDFDAVFVNGTKLREEQRRGECVLSCEAGCSHLCIGVLSCIKGSRFLHDWREGYHKDYRPDLWIYNSGTNTPMDLIRKGIYQVVIDPDISMYPSWSKAQKEWLGSGRQVKWRGKALSHYFCRGVLQNGKEILDMDNSLGDMFRYIYDYKQDGNHH